MKVIGGYFELELANGNEYYPSLISLNTGRNALEYILRVKGYNLIYIPFYTCDVLLEPIKKTGVKFKYYSIDENLDPIIDFKLDSTECLLYTNYFGVKQETAIKLSKELNNLILDNCQAFFSQPLNEVNTFYSCRKFLGVPDGAYLQINSPQRLNVEKDVSYERCSHLLKRIDLGAEGGYFDFLENNRLLENNPIRSMSKLTQRLLSNISYHLCKQKRSENFHYLHQHLKKYNCLNLNEVGRDDAPMVYPLLIDHPNLKKTLIEKKIFVATYWPNVLRSVKSNQFEYYLTQNLVPLSVDQRYSLQDLEIIIEFIKTEIDG
jgi:hypothetical protein